MKLMVMKRNVVVSLDTSRLRLDSMDTLENKLTECLNEVKKITEVYKEKRANILRR